MFRRSVRTKILGVVFLSIFLITLLFSYLSFEFSKRRLILVLGNSIKGVAATSANFINRGDVELILKNADRIRAKYMASKYMDFADIYQKTTADEADRENERLLLSYFDITNLLSNIMFMNKLDSPINIYVKDANSLKLVLTSSDLLLIGTKYPMRPEARDALLADSPSSTGIYKDKN